jgi:hypothetical protein
MALAQAAKTNAGAVAELCQLAKTTEASGVGSGGRQARKVHRAAERPDPVGGDFKTPAARALEQGGRCQEDRAALDQADRPLLAMAALEDSSRRHSALTSFAMQQGAADALAAVTAMCDELTRGNACVRPVDERS